MKDLIRPLHFAEFGIKSRSSGGNLVTKHGIEKIIRAPKDYDPNLGAQPAEQGECPPLRARIPGQGTSPGSGALTETFTVFELAAMPPRVTRTQ